MEYYEYYLLPPQPPVLAGADFTVSLISLLPASMEMLLLIIIVTPESFVAFLAGVSQRVLKGVSGP